MVTFSFITTPVSFFYFVESLASSGAYRSLALNSVSLTATDGVGVTPDGTTVVARASRPKSETKEHRTHRHHASDFFHIVRFHDLS